MPIQIKSRFTDTVLLALNAETLVGADLHHADLHHANLHRADLRGADLRRSNLSGSDLHRSDLHRSDLRGSDLRGSYLSGADLSGAIIRDGITIQTVPLQISGLLYPVIIFDAHIQIGCEFHSIEDWASFDDERIARMDGVAARKFWKVHKDAILALANSRKPPSLNCNMGLLDFL